MSRPFPAARFRPGCGLALAAALALPAPAFAADSPPAAATFSLEAVDPPVQIVPPFVTTMFRARLTHLGATPGGYTCRAFRDLPAAWFSSLCSETQCTFDSLDVFLAPGEAETLWVDVFAFGVPGSGTMELRVRAHDPPYGTASHFVGALSGITRVVIDDDAGADYEDFAVDAFAALGITAGVWPLWIAPPRASELAGMSSVYWLTGDETSETLTAADRDELAAFLDAGGRLLVSGQGLGADIGATAFYRHRLGADFVADDAGSVQVAGVAGDPIGDGLDFAIAGGSGANNQTSPDAIAARDAAVFRYANGLGAGARVEGGGIYRSVYLPFGIEGIADEAVRAELLGRILVWLEAAPPVAVGAAPAPAARPRVTVAPNPVAGGGARITIIAAPAAGAATLTLVDAAGRVLARLDAHPAGPGRLGATWDGRDGRGRRAAPGVYFLTVELDSGPAARARLVVAP